MSYDTERKKAYRKPIIAAELGLDSGTITFSDISVKGFDSIPIITKYSLAPTKLAISQGLGQRGITKITISDYEDGLPGSFLSRLLADNPYYLDRAMTIKVGYVTDNFNPATDLSDRFYFIESIDGPNEKGQVTITGRDALKSLYVEKAKAPGNAKTTLNANVSANKTGNVNVGDNTDFTNSGWIIIDEEIIEYSGKTGGGLVFSTRGAFGTTAVSHSGGDELAEILAWDGTNCVDAIRDLILNYTDIPPSFINNVEWDAERDNFLGSELLFGPGAITPEPVKDIINNIAEQCYLNLWYDERDQEIKIKANGPTLFPLLKYTDNEILDEKARIKRNLKQRITQVWYYYEKINKNKGNQASNFSQLLIDIDPALETAAQYGSPAVRIVYADLIDGAATAIKVASRLLETKKDGDTLLTFKLDAKDIDFWTGSYIELNTDLITNNVGANIDIQAQVIKVTEKDGHTYEIEAIQTGQGDVVRYATIGPDTLLDYPLESPANTLAYAFIGQDAAPFFADLTPAYRLI